MNKKKIELIRFVEQQVVEHVHNPVTCKDIRIIVIKGDKANAGVITGNLIELALVSEEELVSAQANMLMKRLNDE